MSNNGNCEGASGRGRNGIDANDQSQVTTDFYIKSNQRNC